MTQLKAIRIFLLAILFGVTPIFANGPETTSKDIPDILVKAFASVTKNNLLAISFKNAPGWHTYWKNPGDAGLPIKFEFKAGNLDLKDGPMELEWPAPKRFIEEGDMLAYGYIDEYTLFFTLSDELKKKLQAQEFQINISWLACKHVCVPGKTELKSLFKNNQFSVKSHEDFSVSDLELEKRYHELPEKSEEANQFDFILAKRGENQLTLYYNFSLPSGVSVDQERGLLMPMMALPFNFKREILKQGSDGHLYGKIDIDWDGEYQEPPMSFPTDGRFNKSYSLRFLFHTKNQKSLVIERSFNSFGLEAGPKIESFMQNLTLVPIQNPNNSKDQTQIIDILDNHSKTDQKVEKSFFLYLFLAFLGGLILNIMPCVLPVISLKLFSLVRSQSEGHKAIVKHNIVYSAGVLFTFLILAFIVIGLKSVGTEIGWGFQLQSPFFVALMIIVLFLLSLNLFGVFEIATPGGKVLGNIQIKNRPLSDFFSGILATILATPCSAPFLGTALTFAFTSSSLTIICIFLSIGLGLAFPFLVTSLRPSMISILPKPGAWMNDVKKFLSLGLLLSVIWLIDVFVALTEAWGGLPLIQILTTLTLVFFAASWKVKNRIHLVIKTVFITSSIGLVSALWATLADTKISDQNQGPKVSSLIIEKNRKGITWEPWSEKRMMELQDQGKTVFVDFTARWCFTCKVNEKLVLSTDSFKELASKYELVLLLADWTSRDKAIGDWLIKQGKVGVPAYFIQKKNGELIDLGETITIGKIEKALH